MVAGLFILERTCTLNEPILYIYTFELKNQHVVRVYNNIDI